MKLVIAQMKHETNTFSPVPTPLSRFAQGTELPPMGDAAVQAYRGTGAALAAFIALAGEAGAGYVLPIAASAWPSGPGAVAGFECMSLRIVDGGAQGVECE